MAALVPHERSEPQPEDVAMAMVQIVTQALTLLCDQLTILADGLDAIADDMAANRAAIPTPYRWIDH